MISPRAVALNGFGFPSRFVALDGLVPFVQFFFSNPPIADGNELAFQSQAAAKRKRKKRLEEEALLFGRRSLLP